MNEKNARLLLGGALPAALAAIGFGPYLAFRSELPDRIASHFDLAGTPDGSMTHTQLLLTTGAMMLFGLGACVFAALSRHQFSVSVVPTIAGVGGLVAGSAATILISTTLTQRGIERWEDAGFSWWGVLLLLGGGLVPGGAAARLAAELPTAAIGAAAAVMPAMDLAPGEHAVWTSTLYSRWPLALGSATLVSAGVLLVLTDVWLAVVVAVSAVPILGLSRIRVSASSDGLRVVYGFVGWPHTTIEIDRINAASAIHVKPTQWGGWGYRGSLKVMKRAAVVLRAGPGIRLDLIEGRVFAVTVDDPETGVALLNAELGRRVDVESR